MRLQMEVTNQEVLHGEEMVREVLMDMLREMRPPPQHNAFECRNCQWVERRGKMMLKLCEIVRLIIPLLLLMRRIFVAPACRPKIALVLILKGGPNKLFLTGSLYVVNLNTYGANLGEQLLSL